MTAFSSAGERLRNNSPSSKSVVQATRAAQTFLVEHLQPNGQFIYLTDAHDCRPIPADYNMIRHAGALYALTQYQLRFPNERTLEAIRLASQFLISKGLFETREKRQSMFAVFSDLEKQRPQGNRETKLGAAGLGLVALLSAEHVHPGTTPLTTLEGIGRFLLFMQDQDGSFFSKYTRFQSIATRSDQFKSLYYPGEAILGLAMLYAIDPNPDWLNGALKGMRYLATSRANLSTVPDDNWALIATAELIKHRETMPQSHRDAFIQQTLQIVQADLKEQNLKDDMAGTSGSFTPDHRTTPSSTRLEGLLSALTYLPPTQVILKKKMEASIRAGIQFLMNSQINRGPCKGAIPDSFSGRELGPVRVPHEVRIDYVQHAMSALLKYNDHLNSRSELF